MGPTVVLDTGGVEIVLVICGQVEPAAQDTFTVLGIEPRDKRSW